MKVENESFVSRAAPICIFSLLIGSEAIMATENIKG